MTPEAPRAAARPVELTNHGDTRTDPWYWLRDREDPEVIAYLNRLSDLLFVLARAAPPNTARSIGAFSHVSLPLSSARASSGAAPSGPSR